MPDVTNAVRSTRGVEPARRNAPRLARASTSQKSHQLRTSQRRVLQALTWADGLTRTALANELGMPKATVTGLVDSLISRGLVSEEAAPSSRGRAGRPAKVLWANGPSPTAGVVLLSGGQMVGAVVTYAGAVLGRASGPFSVDSGKESIELAIEVLTDAFKQAEQKRSAEDGKVPGSASSGLARKALAELGLPVDGPTAIVLGIPAPFLSKSGVPAFNQLSAETAKLVSDVPAYRHWVNSDVVEELEKAFGVPAIIENDANLGAIGEATFGAGQGIDSFVFLKLARGVGAGLVVGGRLHRGATGFAGELGHVHVREDGPLCPCGGRGCLGGILGDALVQSVQPAYDRTLTLRDVLDLAASGDPGPRRVLGDLGRTMGRPLADFATLLNPGAIIVDGSFAPAVDYIVAGIRETVDRYAAPVAAAALKVTAGALGEDAELLGAAVLARVRQSESGPRPKLPR